MHTKKTKVISAGLLKITSNKKIVPHTAKLIVNQFIKNIYNKKVTIILYFKGFHRRPVRYTILHIFYKSNITIKFIGHLTMLAHNGCRLKKQRRK